MGKLIGILFWACGSVLASEENCRLTIRSHHKGGKVKVEVVEIHTESKEACKNEALNRQKTEDSDITKITASFKWYGD